MSIGRWSHSATLLNDGRVLIVGGKEKPYGSIPSTEVFDPGNNSWSSAGNTLNPRGEGHTSTLLNNGQVLITGGTEDNSSELYNPDANSWEYTNSMTNARKWASATLLTDGRVIIAGGDDSSRSGSKKLNTAEIYNPSTNQWSPTKNMNDSHSGHSATIIDGKLLIVGRDSAELFDPSTGLWELAGKPVRARSTGSTATTMANGKVLVTGGEWVHGGFLQGTKGGGLYTAGSIGTGTGNDGGKHPMIHMPIIIPLEDVELYDAENDIWQSTDKMSEGKRHHKAILTTDDKVIVIGNIQIEIFDPNTQTWSTMGNLNYDHGESHTATLMLNNKILVTGGRIQTKNSYKSLTTTEIFEIN